MVDMVDCTDVGVCLEGSLVDGQTIGVFFVGTHLFKTWRKFCQVRQCGSRARMFINSKRQGTIVMEDGNQGLFKSTFLYGYRGTCLAFGGKRITVLAAKAFNSCNQVRRDSLGNHVELSTKVCIVCSEAIDMHRRRARHGFNSTGNYDILHSRQDAHSRKVDSLLARATKAIQCDSRCIK